MSASMTPGGREGAGRKHPSGGQFHLVGASADTASALRYAAVNWGIFQRRSEATSLADNAIASKRSAKTRFLTCGQEGRGQLGRTAALPRLSEADPLESVVLITVYDDFRSPGYFQGEDGPLNVVGCNRAWTGPQPSLLMQLAGYASRQFSPGLREPVGGVHAQSPSRAGPP